MKLRKERSISIVYDAVSISKDIEVIGGPLTLNFYVESVSYVPNRFLTPLVLKPIVYIVDPNKIIPEGDKSDELIKCNWYEDGEKIVSGDDYKINKDNSLTILKNSTKDLREGESSTLTPMVYNRVLNQKVIGYTYEYSILNNMLELISKETGATYTMTTEKLAQNGDNLNVVINAII